MGYWSSAEASIEEDFSVSGHLGVVFNLLAPGASVLGGPLINLVINRTGRRLASVIIAAVAFSSWVSLGLCELLPNKHRHFWVPCVLRAVLGVTVGATSSVTPMYITELAPDDLRGVFGTLHQFGISMGASMCYLLGAVKRDGRHLNWAKVAYYSCIPTGLHLFLVWFVPESPAVARREDLKSTESLCQGRFIRPMIIAALLMFFQQFGGTSAFLANLQPIFKKSGAAIAPALASLLVGLAGAFAAFVASPLIGAYGRKAMWNVSSTLQAVTLTIAALEERYRWSNVVPVVCLFIDNFTFGVGTAPIPWFFVPELFPDSVRSLACAIITAFCWILGTLLFFIWDEMERGIGQAGGFGVFAGIMGLSLLFGIIWLPEPKASDMIDEQQKQDAEPGSQALLTNSLTRE
jgi:MFS family permease